MRTVRGPSSSVVGHSAALARSILGSTLRSSRPQRGTRPVISCRAAASSRESRAAAPAGDGSDVRWELSGILDWDLAHAGDGARNVAYLGIWHGEERIEDIARTPAEARRARVWLGAAGLDSLDDAAARQELTGRAPRWGRLLRKVVPRIERASCALAGR